MNLTTPKLFWMSRLGCLYSILFVSVSFAIGNLEVFPNLYPNTYSFYAVLHRTFAFYILIYFFLNFYLSYVNHSFASLEYICADETCPHNQNDDNNIQLKTSNCKHYDTLCFQYHTQTHLKYTHMFAYNFCNICKIIKQPRSHHCVICNRCVNVREHHCFVLGTCIGNQNLRYFMGLLLSLAVGSFYSLSQLLQYLSLFYPHPFSLSSLLHYFPPFTLIEVFLSYQSWLFFMYVFMLYTGFAAFIGSSYSFVYHLSLILRGVTSHEHLTNQKGPSRPAMLNFKEVFGQGWYMGLLCPLLYHRINGSIKAV